MAQEGTGKSGHVTMAFDALRLHLCRAEHSANRETKHCADLQLRVLGYLSLVCLFDVGMRLSPFCAHSARHSYITGVARTFASFEYALMPYGYEICVRVVYAIFPNVQGTAPPRSRVQRLRAQIRTARARGARAPLERLARARVAVHGATTAQFVRVARLRSA